MIVLMTGVGPPPVKQFRDRIHSDQMQFTSKILPLSSDALIPKLYSRHLDGHNAQLDTKN